MMITIDVGATKERATEKRATKGLLVKQMELPERPAPICSA